MFSLNSESGFAWNGFCDTTASELLSTNGPSITKTEQAEKLILEMLGSGEVASDELLHRSSALGISERTLKIAKQNLGVSAIRRGDRRYVQIAEPIQEPAEYDTKESLYRKMCPACGCEQTRTLSAAEQFSITGQKGNQYTMQYVCLNPDCQYYW